MKLKYSAKTKFNNLPALIAKYPKDVDRAVKAAAFETERHIKTSFTSGRSLPGQPPGIDTGKLRAGINTKKIREMSYSVNTGDTEYAPWLEFGTHRGKGKSRRRWMAARPFMGPAAKEAHKFLVESFERTFGK